MIIEILGLVNKYLIITVAGGTEILD